MAWTGFQFGDAWPYLAAGYGLFVAGFVLGFALIYRQARAVRRQEALVAKLYGERGQDHGR